MNSIPYGRQSISDGDVQAVSAALRAEFLTQGPTVARFEEALAARVGARHAVAFNSGTATLHAMYAGLGVGPGRSVITSPITFVATANAALYLGARCEFVDVDPTTGVLSLDALHRCAAPAGTVLSVVHLAGAVAELGRIEQLAAERGWVVVEDAAHALGATYRCDDREERVGACRHSVASSFSFHPVKHITTAEGGAVTTNSGELAEFLRRFRSHGITRDPSLMRSNDGPWYYEQVDLGFNYRVTDVQCALGLSQLSRLDEFVERRRQIAARYDAAFGASERVSPLLQPAGSRSSYHLYVVRVDSERRRWIFERMRHAGIGVNVHYIPVYQQPYYRAHGHADTRLPGAEAYYAGAMSLPMFPDLRPGEQEFVIRTLLELAGER